MQAKSISKEVYVADGPVVKVGRQDIDFLKARVDTNERKRIRLSAHGDIGDKLHEMFIVLAKETYIRPHKHLDKAESLHVIEGLVDVVLFAEDGEVTEVIPLGEYSSGRQFYYRIGEPIYHTLIIQSHLLVFHETTQGPFKRSDTIFAPWAPEDRDATAAPKYMARLAREADQFMRRKGKG